ncbi:hypothetical protein BHM03_00018802 [Ensete ventricosum]|uniref:Uncharacterized protein n=1 Tax=Ensete ventricosum TaxID=4639 RepID=A0A445MFC4_ENSVE|nr:hypothetical protein BHM03_00018802 [Ensete ventricosum]
MGSSIIFPPESKREQNPPEAYHEHEDGCNTKPPNLPVRRRKAKKTDRMHRGTRSIDRSKERVGSMHEMLRVRGCQHTYLGGERISGGHGEATETLELAKAKSGSRSLVFAITTDGTRRPVLKRQD